MGSDSSKKFTVILIAALLTIFEVLAILLLVILGIPTPAIAVIAIVNIAVLAALFHYCKERIEEIDERIDNDTDNY